MSKSNVWNYLWSWRLRRVLQVSVLVSGMFVFSWFLLSFCCAGWRLCWRLLSPGVPVSRYGPVLGTWTLDPARVLSWTHKSPLNIFSQPASQGHGLLTPWQLHRGKLIPDTETRSDPQFHDLTIAIVDCGSLCYLFANIILRFVLVLLIVSE